MLIVRIQNTTDLAPVSDYRYEVLVNLEVIASGEVEGHVRADGWAELVWRVIEPYLPCPHCGGSGYLSDKGQPGTAEFCGCCGE